MISYYDQSSSRCLFTRESFVWKPEKWNCVRFLMSHLYRWFFVCCLATQSHTHSHESIKNDDTSFRFQKSRKIRIYFHWCMQPDWLSQYSQSVSLSFIPPAIQCEYVTAVWMTMVEWSLLSIKHGLCVSLWVYAVYMLHTLDTLIHDMSLEWEYRIFLPDKHFYL